MHFEPRISPDWSRWTRPESEPDTESQSDPDTDPQPDSQRKTAHHESVQSSCIAFLQEPMSQANFREV